MDNINLTPINHKVLVEEQPMKKTYGKTNIVIPENKMELYQAAVTSGKIIDMAIDAFDYYELTAKPKIGDIVIFPKYSSAFAFKRDGKDYRLIEDEAIGMISDKYLEEEDNNGNA